VGIGGSADYAMHLAKEAIARPVGTRNPDPEVAKLEEELEAARPFLPLAREISDDVARLAADGSTSTDVLADAIAAVPQRERLEVARAVFDRLDPDQQWAVIERAFGDEEIRAALAAEHVARLDEVRRTAAQRELARTARAEHRLHTRSVPEHELLTLGLFREADAAPAVGRRPRSAGAARRVVLRRLADEAGTFAVVEDVFNPDGGYFVGAEYDRDAWQRERLRPHALVRPGSLSPSAFEPVLYAGGRVDVEEGSTYREGLLHLGYAMVGDEDVFAEGGST
jgi:hypothetical protein